MPNIKIGLTWNQLETLINVLYNVEQVAKLMPAPWHVTFFCGDGHTKRYCSGYEQGYRPEYLALM